jgi:hypothetical protein
MAEGASKHSRLAARQRLEEFRERGIPICSVPRYETQKPIVETAAAPMNAHQFEPKLK